MPIYEYECGACTERHEFIQKFSDSPKRKCPACGASRLKRLVSAAAFHLKGTGWYVTDFRDKDKKKGDDKEAASSSKDAGKDGTKDSTKSSTEKTAETTTKKTTEKTTKSSDSGKKSAG
jgi:putative FmdB family regulatory protein